MQEVLIIRGYSARITKNIMYNKIIKVIAQEVLNKDGISVKCKKYNYVNYLRVRPLVLSNTLSQMWDSLNLPMLLFKEGLLTLM